jgi:hypothetical protein
MTASWPPWLEGLSDRDRVRAIVDAVARCYADPMDHPGAVQHCTAGVAVMLLEQVLVPEADDGVAAAVLLTMRRDGSVEQTSVPPFVAEPILAAERARRAAQPALGATEAPGPVAEDTGAAAGYVEAAQ